MELSDEKHRQITDSFANQSMMATLGARLEKVAHGSVEIHAPILSGARQQHGFAHAGLTFSIGDSAAGYAALTVMPDGHEVLTTEMKINLLAPAEGDILIARGRVIKTRTASGDRSGGCFRDQKRIRNAHRAIDGNDASSGPIKKTPAVRPGF